MSYAGKYCSHGAILLQIVTSVLAYHFDVNNIILYEDMAKQAESRGSYFGYSVALYNTSSTQKSFIFIGAPRANVSAYGKVNEPGTVYKCEIGELCEEWVMNGHKNKRPQEGSWLGGTMIVGKASYDDKDIDIVLVCASRWLDKNKNKKDHSTKSVEWLMSGMCYRTWASDTSALGSEVWTALEPLKEADDIYNSTLYFAMGQSGFSAHMISDDTDLHYILGCPGTYLWHGIPIISDNDQIIKTPSFIIPSARKDTSVKDDDYSGYAVTSGFYFNAWTRIYVTGAPRAANLLGKVILFDFPKASQPKEGKIVVIKSYTGNQIGEYFGSALASCNVDGDETDDLLVGAPLWSKNSEEGRIYIFRGNKKNNKDFKETEIIDGKRYRGRFGSAITCLRDVDYDGYNDIAVGAPYDDNGAVYIYHGSKHGLRHTQTILSPKGARGFGISISEPRDIDNNNYADIAVGAYSSGHVAVFRSKRVVNMSVTLSSSLSGEPLRHDAESFSVSICSSYNGSYAPQELNVTVELLVDQVHQRAGIIIAGRPHRTYEFNTTVTKIKAVCQHFTISLKNQHHNFLDPLKVSVIQRLNVNNETGILLVKKNHTIKTEHFNKFSAVMSKNQQEIHEQLDIIFALDCGNDTICNSHLSIRMSTNLESVDQYVIGSMRYINLNIIVTNTGDQAYFTQAIVSIPMFIHLRLLPSTCTKAKMSNRITCDIDNPLNRNDTKIVSLELDMSQVRSDTEKFYLNAIATTKSNDTGSGNYNTSLLINCVAQTDIGIAGQANKDSYWYTLVTKEDQLPNITFDHIYEIKNHEVTPIDEALLSVSVPTHWIHGGNEIEIVTVNQITGDLDEREFSRMEIEENMYIGTSSNDTLAMTELLNSNLTEGNTFDMSLDNRTLYINCTNPSFKWKTINYKLGPFQSAQSVAKLIFTFDLLLSNITRKIIENKDIIYFVTNASTRVIMPHGTAQTINNKPDSILIGTMFIGSAPPYHLPAVLIPLSITAGLLLLVFVAFGLFKLGFFKRTKKAQLQAQKDNMTPKVCLETTSSTETLDNAYYVR